MFLKFSPCLKCHIPKTLPELGKKKPTKERAQTCIITIVQQAKIL